MSVVGFIRRALAMGIDYDTALRMGEAFEAEMPVYVPPSEEARDERRRRLDRERKQRVRHPVADNSADKADFPQKSAKSADSADNSAKNADKSGQPRAPTYTGGENNLSRLEVTGLAVAVAEDASAVGSDWPGGDAVQHAKLLVEAANSPRLSPAKQLGLHTTAGRLDAWKRDGASWTYDVVPAVTIMSQKRGPPIATWKYFDQAIAQSIADNRRALEIPSARPRHERPDQPSAKRTAREDNLARSFAASEAVARSRALG